MKRQLPDHSHTAFLIFIMLIATIMRLWQFDTFSYSNDELSAIIRLEYNNLSDLIEYGVKKNDFHPAGVQVFLYYWTKVFGDSETAVRIPFVIAGILAVLFSYQVAKMWFGKNTALFTAAAIAALSYPILYSQIARPYSVGLFFCMAGVYFWSKLIFENKWKDYKILSGYILFSALAAYTHHFSFLFMIIVGATGLFFIHKEDLKIYLLAAFAVFVMYLLHIPVFLYQFGIGGVGGEEGWLGKPKEDWFWQYLSYIFNNSFFLIYLTAILVIAAIIYRIINKNFRFNKFHAISLIWFLILYFIGYYYSIYRNPVLQNSILIFSFPFLFIFLFSFIPNMNKKFVYLLLLIFTFSVIYSTSLEKDYYNQQHFGEFKDLTARVDEWHSHYGSENITQIIRTNSRKYLDFYFNKTGKSYEFLKYEAYNRNDFLELKEIIKNNETPYFIYGWTLMGSYTPEDILITEYPCIVEERKYSGLSYIALYYKDSLADCIEEKFIAQFSTDINSGEIWNYNSELVVATFGRYGIAIVNQEFGPTFSKSIGEIANGNSKRARIKFKAFSKDVGAAQTVVTYDSKKEVAYEWLSVQLDYFVKENVWFDVVNTFKLPEYRSQDDVIKIYIWNVNKSDIFISDMKIEFFEKEY
jgi:hypothetical protein